ncbi:MULTISPECIES: hypothetical protein [Flavobacterium]|uniref:hypothetical protein n=1 Tax=Flavobacterium TaxID=237 RepID=UPI00211549ED|nr:MULTISPECIES: hypothetical protein [Flavobacterium]UUF15189.1 hypothetical protein NLJ00_03580 [Flavobacterium panici]
MKKEEIRMIMTHNQVVPGSSPGGTTSLEIESLYRNVEAFLFSYDKGFIYIYSNSLKEKLLQNIDNI